jgi:hypothetical protein
MLNTIESVRAQVQSLAARSRMILMASVRASGAHWATVPVRAEHIDPRMTGPAGMRCAIRQARWAADYLAENTAASDLAQRRNSAR